MAGVSLHDLGIDRLSIEERLQVAEAIWVASSTKWKQKRNGKTAFGRCECHTRGDQVAGGKATAPWDFCVTRPSRRAPTTTSIHRARTRYRRATTRAWAQSAERVAGRGRVPRKAWR
jgi:hypothetical protein